MRRTIALLSFIALLGVNPAMYSGLHWRNIGPFRGGRTVAVSGVPGEPNVFYMAPNNGGVWKTTDYGRTWKPVFDGQPSGSIGALAVAPSSPQTVYVGSGEGLQRPDLSTGDGVYKSIDGGATWRHLGLRDAQQIGAIVVDPHDANRLWVAALGHPYGPNAERGVYRSIDGGATFQRVLYKDENTGAIALALDPSNSNTIYADLWAARHSPWTAGETLERRDLSGLYKSTDGGTTWTPLRTGLPAQFGRIGIAIAPSNPKRLYAIVDSDVPAVYTSADAGATWYVRNTEERISGRGQDFAGITVDPRNERVVWVANTSTYRSDDGGKTYTAIKGAPGGDDYHTIWIDPQNSQVMLLGVDQGATITVNGGQTWSSWYNQPTAQFFHVITDNQFPYWVYGAQQESGSAGTRSRSDDGEISFRDWHPVGTEEYGYVAPDPLHPSIIYGGKVQRYDTRTGEVQEVGPIVFRDKTHRFDRTAPLIFSPTDPHALYLGSNVLYVTRNGGHSWKVISPDLTRPSPGVPPNLGIFAQTPAARVTHRGVIYALAPSPRKDGLIWAGTYEGLLWKTPDGGKHWHNVTPAHLRAAPWSKIAQIDASHFDANTAYVAVNRLRVDDLHPYVLRTHDGGKTWQSIAGGLPPDAPVNVVREDPVQRGLLFAGTERAVYVSFDDGDHWQSLQLNLPATSMRDLVVHGDDVVVGTHGRSFWILDNVTPLRQLARRNAERVELFAPAAAYRVRWNENTDTPLPPEEPAGENPYDGAAIDYYLPAAAGAVTIEIRDSAGSLVRRYASSDRPYDDSKLDKPTYWFRPRAIPGTQAGMHRFVWDLRYAPPAVPEHDYRISAIAHDTPREPRGAVALPGRYTVVLTAAGQSRSATLALKMDPRVHEPRAQLVAQFVTARGLTAALDDVMRRLAGAPPARRERLLELQGRLSALLDTVNSVDAEPTVQVLDAVRRTLADLAALR